MSQARTAPSRRRGRGVCGRDDASHPDPCHPRRPPLLRIRCFLVFLVAGGRHPDHLR